MIQLCNYILNFWISLAINMHDMAFVLHKLAFFSSDLFNVTYALTIHSPHLLYDHRAYACRYMIMWLYYCVAANNFFACVHPSEATLYMNQKII